MKKDKIKVKMICDKCGKEMPLDNEKSNENWQVYKQDCVCGGRAKFEII